MTPSQIITDRVRGCMVGAVLGDCLGAPVECTYWSGISKKAVRKRFDAYKEKGSDQVVENQSLMRYTDDTAMARQVALSLIDNNGLVVTDLAKRFVEEYKKEPRRGYGQSVGEVFRKLELTNFATENEVFKPASEQFDGSGSYGNGAPMRVHPIGLFGKTMLEVEKMAEKQAKLTHAHNGGIMGGILQATAVHLATKQVTTQDMLGQLTELSERWEKDNSKSSSINEEDGDFVSNSNLTYLQQLKCIENLLDEDVSEENLENIVNKLGNDIAAVRSAPTALFCFLKAKNPVEGFCESSPFQRTLELAMSFGGDTDTIMSMAGAIAGAYYGEKEIPQYLINLCEGIQDARTQADELFTLIEKNSSE